MHTLRHTFATRAIEAGIKPKTLQEILGHSNIGIILGSAANSTNPVGINSVCLRCRPRLAGASLRPPPQHTKFLLDIICTVCNRTEYTMNLYVHVTDEEKEKKIRKFELAFQAV